jgi:hypothetical protein
MGKRALLVKPKHLELNQYKTHNMTHDKQLIMGNMGSAVGSECERAKVYHGRVFRRVPF